MEEKYRKYLMTMRMSIDLVEKIEEIITFYSNVLNYNIDDIFISEYKEKEGKQVFESLFLFSGNNIMEAKNFLNEDDFDFTSLNRFYHWRIQKEAYDFETVEMESKMSLFLYAGLAEATLKASGRNCKKLSEIFKEIIKPKID